MYFCIFCNGEDSSVYFETLDFIDISEDIELYELKKKITRIEEKFEAYKYTHTKGDYQLIIKSYDPGKKERKL